MEIRVVKRETSLKVDNIGEWKNEGFVCWILKFREIAPPEERANKNLGKMQSGPSPLLNSNLRFDRHHHLFDRPRNSSRKRRRHSPSCLLHPSEKSEDDCPLEPKVCILGRFSEHIPFYDPGSLHERFRIVTENTRASYCASQIRPSSGDPSWNGVNFRQLLAVGEYSSRGLVSVYDIDAIETKMSRKGPNLQRVGFTSCVSNPIFSYRAEGGRRVSAIQPIVCGMTTPRIFCAFEDRHSRSRSLASLCVVKLDSLERRLAKSTPIGTAGMGTIRTMDANPSGERLRSIRVFVGGGADFGGPGKILAFRAHRPPSRVEGVKYCCLFGSGVHERTIIGLQVDSRNDVLYCAGADRKISLWDIRDVREPGDCFDSVELELRPSCLLIVPDKNLLLVGLSRHVAVFDKRKMHQPVRNILIRGIRRSRTKNSHVIKIDRIGCDKFVSVAGDLLTVWNVESGENLRRVELSPSMKKHKPTIYGLSVVGRKDSIEDYELIGRDDRQRAVFALDFVAGSVKLVIGPPFIEFVLRKWML